MANLSTARQSNTDTTVQEPGGYSGSTSGISGGNTAIRKSVAYTQGGTYSQSAVYSETKGFPTAYGGVECDSPAIDRS
tara:strand:- start:128 stop:361 length:234 start_codon:yes stop_codon:yes gene_type:complete